MPTANAKFFTYTGLSKSARTGLPPIMDFIRRRRLSVFDHIVLLTQRLLHMTPFTVKSLCHPVVHMIGTGRVQKILVFEKAQPTGFYWVLGLYWIFGFFLFERAVGKLVG